VKASSFRFPQDDDDEDFLSRPRVKLVGNMHGNEPTGREILLYLARFLLEEANSRDSPDPRIVALLASTDLYILPTMNPDGFHRGTEGKCSGGSYASGRLNEGRKDLNRDFPDYWAWEESKRSPDFDLKEDKQKVQAEMLMILKR